MQTSLAYKTHEDESSERMLEVVCDSKALAHYNSPSFITSCLTMVAPAALGYRFPILAKS